MQPVRKSELEYDDTAMPLTEHLAELRKMALRICATMAIGLCSTYHYSEKIVYYLEKPLLDALPKENAELIFTGVADKFIVYFKVSLLAALLLTLPYILYQIFTFLSPALLPKERKKVIPFLFFGTLAFYVGFFFSYKVILPAGYTYLINFETIGRERAMISLTEYFTLTLQLLFSVALIFEVPVVLILLGILGLVTDQMLAQYRKQALVASAVISAVATPSPDAFTMVIVMVPLYLLYEMSILGIRVLKWRNTRNTEN